MIRFIWLVCLSIAGGIMAALTFAASIGPGAGLRSLTLPAVSQIACLFGALAGLLISPLLVWALHDKKLWFAVPCVYGSACLLIIVLNLLEVRFSELIALGVTAAGLFLYGLFGKRHPHLGISRDDV